VDESAEGLKGSMQRKFGEKEKSLQDEGENGKDMNWDADSLVGVCVCLWGVCGPLF